MISETPPGKLITVTIFHKQTHFDPSAADREKEKLLLINNFSFYHNVLTIPSYHNSAEDDFEDILSKKWKSSIIELITNDKKW